VIPDGDGGRRCTRRRLLAVGAALAMVTAAQPLRAEGRTHRIEMRDVTFVPAQVTVRAGDRVAWDNADIVAHTATSEEGGVGSTSTSSPGARGAPS
jgi:plastocyanin